MNEREGKQRRFELPTDTLFCEILPRVPASSLLRLRAVCKSWNSLIRNDPAFARANLECALHAMPASCRVMFYKILTKELVSLDEAMSRPKTVLTSRNFFRVSPPCDGLVCIYRVSSKCGGLCLKLLNLTTRELLRLPKLQNPDRARTFHLGYDPSTNKYKVVCHALNRLECQVLTVGSGTTWRRIGSTEIRDLCPYESVAIGGFLFRIMKHKNGLDTIPVLFDVKEEKFRLLPLPKSSSSPRITVGNVFDIEGKPSYVEEDYKRSIFTYGLHLWTLMDVDREVWIHRCIMPAAIGLDHEVRIRGYPPALVSSRPVLIHKDKVLLLCGSHFYYLHLRPGGGIDRWEEVHYGGGDQQYHRVHPFVGNLTSLKAMLTSA